MAAITGANYGKQLCEIFKLDPKKVASISFTIFPDDIVYVNVSEVVYEEEMKRIVEITKEFQLERTDTTSEINDRNISQTFE